MDHVEAKWQLLRKLVKYRRHSYGVLSAMIGDSQVFEVIAPPEFPIWSTSTSSGTTSRAARFESWDRSTAAAGVRFTRSATAILKLRQPLDVIAGGHRG
jgi:hypothetical protein